MEEKTLSNKAFSRSRRDRCNALREHVTKKWGVILSGLRRKKPHSQVVQEAEFALVGIGIALLRSHALKAAFALNRCEDFAGAGREIAFLPECRFELSAAVSCFLLAENGQLQPAAFLRRVSGLLCAHRKGAQNALRLPLNTMSLTLFRATIHSSEVFQCYTSSFREEKSGRENPL